MANYFDQFDPKEDESKKRPKNFFDQFDEEKPVKPVLDLPAPTPDDPDRSVLSDWAKFGSSILTRMVAPIPETLENVATKAVRPFVTGEAYYTGATGVNALSKAVALIRDAFGTSLSEQEEEKLAAKIAGDRQIAQAKNLLELPKFFDYLNESGEKTAKKLIESTSPQFQRKLEGAEPKGNIINAVKNLDLSEISFGENPTIEGYLANAAQGLGSIFPVVLSFLLTKSTGVASGVGATLTAGEGTDTAKQYIKSKSDAELIADSPYYADLRRSGVSESEARSIISDRAEEGAAVLQGAVGALGGAATSRLLSGVYDKIITGATRSRLRAIAGGFTLGAAEEGVQEFLEGIAAELGINKEVIKEIGEGSFANLVLGALGGGAVGGGRGFVAPLGKRTSKDKDAFDEEIAKAEKEYLAGLKTKETEEVEEVAKVDPLKDVDEDLLTEVKGYLTSLEGAPKDTDANIAKVLRNYATRLGLDPKQGGKTKDRLLKYINKAIEAHEGPAPPTPEKLKLVSDYLQALNAGTATETGGDLFKKLNTLAGRASGLGISLEAGKKRNTTNLLEALSKATGVDLGDYFKRTGEGAGVPGQPPGGTAAGAAGTEPPSVGTTPPSVPPPPGGAGVGDNTIIDELTDIWKSGKDGLPIGLSGITARDRKLIDGVKKARDAGLIDRVPKEIVDYVEKLSAGRPRRFQLQDDGTVEEVSTGPGKPLYLDETGTMSAEEEVNAIAGLYERLAEAFKKVREEGKEGARAGIPLKWKDLQLDERQVFLDALGRERAGAAPLSSRFNEAFDKVAQYRRTKYNYGKQAGIRTQDTRTDALAAYEIDRETESTSRGVEFPAWNDLTKDQQDAYLAKVPMTTGRTVAGPTGEQSRAGFDAVEALLEKPTKEGATDRAYARAQQEIEEEELGLKTPLPKDIEDDVKGGRLGAVLDYLTNYARGLTGRDAQTAVGADVLDRGTNELIDAEQEVRDLEAMYVEQAEERSRLETELETAKPKEAKALQAQLDELVSEEDIDDAKNRVYTLNKKLTQAQIKVDPVTSAVNRLVASVLQRTLKNTKLVYLTDEQIKELGKDPDEFIGEYVPKTDTMYIGKRGLNETAMLHESTHAATVLVLFKYLTGRRNELTTDQIRGAAQIVAIYNRTKNSLSGSFPFAYKNIYEFIAYATSVPKFQLALQKIRVQQNPVEVKIAGKTIFVDPNIYTNFFQNQEDIKTQEEKTGKSIGPEITMWQKFTQAMAQAIGLSRRFGRLIRNKITPQEYFDSVRKQTAKEVTEGLETAEDQEGYEKFVEEVFGTPKKVKEGERDEALIKKLEKQLAKAESEYGATLENTRRLEERMKEMSLAERNKDPDYKAQKAKESVAFDKINSIRDELYDAGAVEYAPKETKGEQRKRLSVTIEPGYLGNAFLELMGAFNDIAAAVPEGGLPGFINIELPIKLKPAKKAPAAKQPTFKESEQRKAERMRSVRSDFASKAEAVKKFFKQPSKEIWLDTVRALQNTKVYLYDLQKTLARSGALKSSGPGQNNTATAVTSSGAIGENVFQRRFYKIQKEINDLLIEIADSYNSDIESVLARLHNYAIFLHDPERRKIKFLREAPLTSVKAVNDREKIVRDVLKIKRKGFRDAAADAQARSLMQQLEVLVATNLDKNSKYKDINNDKYNTLGPESKDYIDNVYGKVYKADPKVKDGTVDRLFDLLHRMDDITRSLNQESNYYSDPVANLVAFYNFKNYFSFKGKNVNVGPKDYQLDPYAQQLSGELQEKEAAFDGRITDSDNPIVNFFVEAVRASRRVGRHRAGLEESIKNNIENYAKGELGFKGKKIKTVTFEQQFDKALSKELKRGTKNIFVRNKNGSVDIYQIDDPKILNAIKKPIQQDKNLVDVAKSALIDSANYLTSLMGQFHTRYNLAFAPVDFIRNTLSYAGVLSAEFGPKEAGKLVSEMSTMMVMEGAIQKTVRYSLAYANGDTARLRMLEKSDPYYKDLKKYYDLGGRVSYMQAVSYKDNLSEMMKYTDRNGLITAKEGVDRFLDAYLDMFEMSARIAAYRVIKDKFEADGMTKGDAEIEAAAYAKNLANFEQVGELGKIGGAMYMFYRPTATGAVRAIEAVYPAFDFRSQKAIMQAMRKSSRYGTMSLEQIRKAYKEYDKQRRSARVTIGAALGFGAMMYMLAYATSGDDDEGRNKTLTDDTARWVRTARFNTGLKVNGKDLVIQIPWGFGVGAFASIGSQIAALGAGAQSFSKFMANTFDAAAESFMPVQVSKIEKSVYPVQSFVDSITPSLLRPAVQFAMNMDSFGREIYAGRTGRALDSYTSNDSIPEMYRDGAKLLYKMTGADVSPNTMYFLVNNYVDGLGRVTSFLYNWMNILRGDKAFDVKSDTLLLDAFLKTTSNYDSRQFGQVENKIKEMTKRYKAAESSGDPMDMITYTQRYPFDKEIIDYYNKFLAGEIKNIRAELNRIRNDKTLSQKERESLLRLYNKQQDILKATFISTLDYRKDLLPDEPMIKRSSKP